MQYDDNNIINTDEQNFNHNNNNIHNTAITDHNLINMKTSYSYNDIYDVETSRFVVSKKKKK